MGKSNNSVVQNNILRALQTRPMHRMELCKALDKPRTTIYENIVCLIENNKIESFNEYNGKRGHPLKYWKICEGVE